MNYKITIDLDAKCPRCGKSGTVNGGPCLNCINKALKNGEFDKIIKKHKKVNP